MNYIFNNRTNMTKSLFLEYEKAAFRITHKKLCAVFLWLFWLAVILGTSAGAVGVKLGRMRLYALAAASGLAALVFLFLFSLAYRLRAALDFKKAQALFGDEATVTYIFSDNDIQQAAMNFRVSLPYAEIQKVLETKHLYIFLRGKDGFILQKSGFEGIEEGAFPAFLKTKISERVPYLNAKKAARLMAGRFFAWLFTVFSTFLGVLQLAYLLVGRRYGIEYIDTAMFYVVNSLLLISAYGAVLLFSPCKTGKKAAATVLFIVLCGADIAAMAAAPRSKAIVSVSPDLTNEMALRQNPATGQTTVFNHTLLLFGRPGEQLPYTAKGPVKTQWLTSDICTVTYREPNRTVHQYIGTFGSRGGASYNYVGAALRGKWEPGSQNTAGKSLTADDTGITVADGAAEKHYSYGDCVQMGTLALILCENGLPQYTVALNQDCRIGESGLVDAGGTITVCPVSMEMTAPAVYVSTSKTGASEPSAPPASSQQTAAGQEGTPAKILAAQLEQSPDLSAFKSRQDLVKIQTDSTDLCLIGRLALEENEKQYAANGYDSEVQINQLTVVAGDQNEFLIEIKSTETASRGKESETVSLDQTYRIKKGNGVYLAIRIGYGADGTAGLAILDTPQKSDTSQDPQYHFITPAQKPQSKA